MALPSESVSFFAALTKAQALKWFLDNAKYCSDAPRLKYAVRVSSKTLYSDDTADLRDQFMRHVEKLKRGKRNA